MELKIITRAEAKEQGLKYYFTGRPCKYTHIARRNVSKGDCTACVNFRASLWQKQNPKKVKQNQNKYKKSNKGQQTQKRYQLLIDHKLSLEDYNEKLQAQNYVCATCHKSDPFNKALAVDHCHKTGRIRGLLCFNCNTSLGKLEDNIETLRRMISYLS